MLRSLLLFLLLALPAHLARAGWALVDNSPHTAPDGLAFSERHVHGDTGDVTLWVVSFDPKTHTFAVMDNPEGAFDLGSAAEKRGALAAVNGGYFQPDHSPLGLLVRQGVEIHPLEHARLLSGVLSVTPAGISLLRTTAFKPSAAVREALQAGPFLVDHGKPITGLESTRTAARTVVFQDTKGRTGFLIAKSTTLAGMAAILSAPELFPDGKIARALNLDGGTSTALWVRGAPPFYAHEWKSVRDYLAIVPR
ncbi:MAG TPA: phosphodiester glycosidase family protein [Chthoniobacter sp.]|jgi:uncharacterized protein YigE (DUF2233 family)